MMFCNAVRCFFFWSPHVNYFFEKKICGIFLAVFLSLFRVRVKEAEVHY